ncbi:hypothetical protein FOL47_003223, partial [Perkinsus chesapeaki]
PLTASRGECRKGGWWQEHVTCRRDFTLDPVLHLSYELDESWDILTNNDGKFKRTGINFNDLPGDPSNEIEFRNGRMYGSVEDERIIVYNPRTKTWDTQAMVEDTPSAFDVSTLGSGGCRVVYSDNFKPWQVSVIYEDSTERKIGGFARNTFAVFVTPDVIVADDSNGPDTVTLNLIDIHSPEMNARVLCRVSLNINPADCLQGMEVICSNSVGRNQGNPGEQTGKWDRYGF